MLETPIEILDAVASLLAVVASVAVLYALRRLFALLDALDTSRRDPNGEALP